MYSPSDLRAEDRDREEAEDLDMLLPAAPAEPRGATPGVKSSAGRGATGARATAP